MGNNSVFDDIGLGASDLGLAPDIDDLNKQINAQQEPPDMPVEALDSNDPKTLSAAERARRATSGRSANILTGASGLEDDKDGARTISRRTLLGS